jgi:hypothetical protein
MKLSISLLPTLAVTSIAQSCSPDAPAFNPAPSAYSQPHTCIPSGYFQAVDVGQTTAASLISLCASKCTDYGSQCGGFAGSLWKAADSNLMTGQCYFYGTLPASPVTCADGPTSLVAQIKDTSLKCLTSSKSAATVFCSSYLSISTKTVYTATTTPTTVITRSATSTKSSTITDRTTVTKTASIPLSTTVFIPSTTTTVSDISTSFSTSFVRRDIQKRAVAPPACLNSAAIPSSRLSSACQCLSIPTPTHFAVFTAPTSSKVSPLPSFCV